VYINPLPRFAPFLSGIIFHMATGDSPVVKLSLGGSENLSVRQSLSVLLVVSHIPRSVMSTVARWTSLTHSTENIENIHVAHNPWNTMDRSASAQIVVIASGQLGDPK